ncbi:hypothetical protein ACHAWF_001090 [Thalassiosira exigua]
MDYDKLKATKFPKDYNAAYEHVLRYDDVPIGCYLISADRLGAGGPYSPFCRWYDRITGQVVDYKIRHDFKAFSSSQLEPMTRFQFRQTAIEKLLFERWFIGGNEAAEEGVLFEAILACHALQSESCFNCKCRNALRWNGGGAASWQDIVCIKCKATYEIKTKADQEKVEKAFKYNNINGGSFSAWCELRNSKQTTQKTYLVVLPRKFTFNRKLEKGEFIDMMEIADQVFKKRFSEKMYNGLHDFYFGSSSSEDEEDEAEAGDAADSRVDDIANELVNVEIVPDDWEDMASDSE